MYLLEIPLGDSDVLTEIIQKLYNIWQDAARLTKARRRDMNDLVDLMNEKLVSFPSPLPGRVTKIVFRKKQWTELATKSHS